MHMSGAAGQARRRRRTFRCRMRNGGMRVIRKRCRLRSSTLSTNRRPSNLASTLNSGTCGMTLPPCESLNSGGGGSSSDRKLRRVRRAREAGA